MHNEPRQKLCELITQYGCSICDDPRRCGALLKDYCGQYKREIFVLVNALENRVATELLNASAGIPEAILLSRLSKRLEDELGLAETAAKWAVETWALALGVIQQPLPITAQISAQAAIPISQAPLTPTAVASPPSAGGNLRFPKFSVGTLNMDMKSQAAVGNVDVPRNQKVTLIVSNDVNDFSFFKNCDPNNLITKIIIKGCKNFKENNFVELKYLLNLKDIKISDVDVSFGSSGLSSIKSFNNLESIDLSGCVFIQDNVALSISNISNLKSLYLGDCTCGITDNGLKHIKKLDKLKILDLNKCSDITGPGVLVNLGEMGNLEYLNLTGCRNVNSSRIQELKQMLPNTRILL